MIGIKVKLNKDFSVIRETLERLGVKNEKHRFFYPSCYCVETHDGNHSIVHFKELISLDKTRTVDISDNDYLRRNTIILLLQNWGLLEVIDDSPLEMMVEKIASIKNDEKKLYTIIHKYKFNRKIII